METPSPKKLTIHNSNYISPKMQLIDIKYAFDISEKNVMKFIYEELIGPGYLKKINERYYAPTQKLLNLTFLPKIFTLQEYQSRFLSYNAYFMRTDLNELLDNEHLVKQLIKLGFFCLQKNGSYSKSTKFEEALVEGETQFSLALIPQKGGDK